MRSPTRSLGERGSGTVLALAIVAVIVGLMYLLAQVTNQYVEQARLNALADNASVAAADALRGLVAGYPCEAAKELAPVTTCEVIGNDVLVEVAQNGLTAKSRAGEPG